MTDSKKIAEEFMKKLKDGKFNREPCPNPPPYYNGENDKIIEDYKDFLDSNLGKQLINLK